MLFGLGDIRLRRRFIDMEEAGDERKRREHRRLDALVGYCEAASCRRQILLAYFGERSEPCGNCDACLAPAALIDATDDAQSVLRAVEATGGRYGAAHLIDVLLGNATEKVVRAGHDRVAIFAAGTRRKKEEWRALIRQLAAAGHLELDIGGFGGLAIADKGRELLRGEVRFLCRPTPPRRRAVRQAREAAALEASGGGASLLVALKQLRLALAKERRVPAYVIFSDRTLLDMAARRPRTVDEFAEVNGVGSVKLKEFAPMFLRAIAAHGAGDDASAHDMGADDRA